MGRKCGVKDCLSDSQRSEDIGVTFHKIPLHSDIRPKWLQLCQITDERKIIYVCSRHFLRADFCNFKGKKYMLKHGVLPSVFPWNKTKTKDNATNETKIPETIKLEPAIKQETDIKLEVIDPIVGDTNVSTNNIRTPVEKPLVEKPLEIKTEAVDSITDGIISPTHSTTIEQKIKTVNTTTGSLTFVPNTRIEALDFKQTWSPATIIEVDYEENEVLVHFDKCSNSYDEWIGINSSSIRAISNKKTMPLKKKNAEEYDEGERCLASWSDARKFPATVTRVVDKDTYEVLFDDGYVKVLKSHRMSKNITKTTPLFDPVQGSKQDRRNKKRKLNVATLFRKKSRTSSQESNNEETPEVIVPEIKKDNNVRWSPSWENGVPVGKETTILISDAFRKSYIVPDPRLPPNWEKHILQRPPDKWEVMIINVPEKKRFRFKSEIQQYLKDNPQLNCNPAMFDFHLTDVKRRKAVRARKKPVIDPYLEDTNADYEPEVYTPRPENLNALKIIQIDGCFKCPIEGCGKNFRRENLAQMHVKHYHPEFTKFLDSTPNVADLAYARTVGENLDRSPGPEKPRAPVGRPKILTPKPTTPKMQPTILEPEQQLHQDVEIIKLLQSNPYDGINSMESSSQEPIPSGLPPNMYPDIKLKDLLNKSESVPKSNELNLKSLSSSVVSRPMGLRTLLPIKKDVKKDEEIETKPNILKAPTVRKEFKRKRIISETVEVPKLKEVYHVYAPDPIEAFIDDPYIPEPDNTIIEGGEIIKIVRMKQEEIINCTCGITEEDGLMIQCELCLCWQHAYCNNIQRENEVPDKYICYICQHPARQRNSKKYMHDQDWLKLGTLPSAKYHCKDEEQLAKRSEKLKISHDLSGGLLELKDFMRTLKLKIKIAEVKNHPKLYLWSKPWEKHSLPEKSDVKMEIKQEISDHQYNKQEQPDSMLLSLLKAAKEKNNELSGFPKIDLNALIANSMQPQPEAAIESSDCRIHLLEHIAHCQSLVEERLSDFEKQINNLDFTLINDNDENYAKIRHTTSMLLKDLNTLKELSQICTF